MPKNRQSLYWETDSFSFLRVSFPPHTEHFTSDTSGHQMSGFLSPHQEILHNTSWMSYSLNSDTIHLEIAPDPQGKGPVP